MIQLQPTQSSSHTHNATSQLITMALRPSGPDKGSHPAEDFLSFLDDSPSRKHLPRAVQSCLTDLSISISCYAEYEASLVTDRLRDFERVR